MSDKTKNVPKIRFPGFTEDWEQRKLGDLAGSFEYGLNASSKDFDGINKYIRITDINDQSREFSKDGLTSPNIELDNADNYLLSKGDILFARTGASVGKSYRYRESDGKVYYAGFLIRVSITEENDAEFVYQNTLTEAYGNFIKVTSQRSGQPGVNAKEYAGFRLSVPSKGEQIQIGNFFTQLDNAITLHQRKLNNLQNKKKSLLQKMFPKNGADVPEIRFPGFTDAWEQRKLGETLEDLKSGLSRMLSNEDIGLPVVRANNINDGKFDMQNDVKYWFVDDPKGAKTDNYLVHKNDILINFINSEAKMGTATIVQEEPNRKTIYTTNILNARTTEEFNRDFWFTLTQTYQYKIDIKTITKPAVNQASFTTADFKKLSYAFPIHKEQQKIGEFFREFDNLITLHQRKLTHLQEQKKALLQQMFV